MYVRAYKRQGHRHLPQPHSKENRWESTDLTMFAFRPSFACIGKRDSRSVYEVSCRVRAKSYPNAPKSEFTPSSGSPVPCLQGFDECPSQCTKLFYSDVFHMCPAILLKFEQSIAARTPTSE